MANQTGIKKKDVEFKVHRWFWRALRSDIEIAPGGPGKKLADILGQTIGKPMDERLQKKKVSLDDWWTKGLNGKIGKKYTQDAVELFAEEINALNKTSPSASDLISGQSASGSNAPGCHSSGRMSYGSHRSPMPRNARCNDWAPRRPMRHRRSSHAPSRGMIVRSVSE